MTDAAVARDDDGARRRDRGRLYRHRPRVLHRRAAATRGHSGPPQPPRVSPSARTRRARWTPSASPGTGRRPAPPVAIINPGAILGPHDPYLGESDQVIREILRGRLPTWPQGGLQRVDVRDTAQVVVAALGRPGCRYLVPGETVTLPHQTLHAVTGRSLPALRIPLKATLPAPARLPHRMVVPTSRRGGCPTHRDAHPRRLLRYPRRPRVDGRSLAESMQDTSALDGRGGPHQPARRRSTAHLTSSYRQRTCCPRGPTRICLFCSSFGVMEHLRPLARAHAQPVRQVQ